MEHNPERMKHGPSEVPSERKSDRQEGDKNTSCRQAA